MTAPVMKVEKLTKRYGAYNAVDAVTFSVQSSEVVGFVGLNGAGKSTTINTILGFLRATSGSIELFGERVLPETAHKTHQKIGFASGDMSLFLNLTGRQYFSFIAGQFRLKNLTRRDELIAMFHPELTKKIGDLSRGNKQKIALIGAFMANPELVILDEPSSGLDPLMQATFIELIRQEQVRGTTIFMSSHYLNEVVDVCTRILLIKAGKLVRDMPAQDLLGSGGKVVRLVSTNRVDTLRRASMVQRSKDDGGYVLTFVYSGKPALLQQWLSSVTGLVDISITDHDVEAAFEEIYEQEAE